MLSGRRLDIVDPSPLDVEIGDIAHGLARVARWNGQTSGPEIFSVAQHALLVEALFSAAEPDPPPGERLAALLHDGPEYVIGDLISPFKAADRLSAFMEATALAGFGEGEAKKLFGEPRIAMRRFQGFLEPMRPGDAEARFLARFAELDGAPASG